MSRNITNGFARSLTVASAALLIHVGAAAAAAPQSDFQRQVSAVLAGNIASHSPLRARSRRDADPSGSKVDTQQFAQQLLLGWSASHPVRAGSATQSRSPIIRQDAPAQGDIQGMVQHLLLGQTQARGAL